MRKDIQDEDCGGFFNPKFWAFQGIATLIFGLVVSFITGGLDGVKGNFAWYVGSFAVATPGIVFMILGRALSKNICGLLALFLVTIEVLTFLWLS